MNALRLAWSFVRNRATLFIVGAIAGALLFAWIQARGFDRVRAGSSSLIVRELPPTRVERESGFEPSSKCPELPVLKLSDRRETELRQRVGRPLEPTGPYSRQDRPGATTVPGAGVDTREAANEPQGEAGREFLFDRRVPPADFGGTVTGSWIAGRPVDVDFVAARPLLFFPGRVFVGGRYGSERPVSAGEAETVWDAHARADLLWIRGRALVGAEIGERHLGPTSSRYYLGTVDFCLWRCPGR